MARASASVRAFPAAEVMPPAPAVVLVATSCWPRTPRPHAGGRPWHPAAGTLWRVEDAATAAFERARAAGDSHIARALSPFVKPRLFAELRRDKNGLLARKLYAAPNPVAVGAAVFAAVLLRDCKLFWLLLELERAPSVPVEAFYEAATISSTDATPDGVGWVRALTRAGAPLPPCALLGALRYGSGAAGVRRLVQAGAEDRPGAFNAFDHAVRQLHDADAAVALVRANPSRLFADTLLRYAASGCAARSP